MYISVRPSEHAGTHADVEAEKKRDLKREVLKIGNTLVKLEHGQGKLEIVSCYSEWVSTMQPIALRPMEGDKIGREGFVAPKLKLCSRKRLPAGPSQKSLQQIRLSKRVLLLYTGSAISRVFAAMMSDNHQSVLCRGV